VPVRSDRGRRSGRLDRPDLTVDGFTTMPKEIRTFADLRRCPVRTLINVPLADLEGCPSPPREFAGCHAASIGRSAVSSVVRLGTPPRTS